MTEESNIRDPPPGHNATNRVYDILENVSEHEKNDETLVSSELSI